MKKLFKCGAILLAVTILSFSGYWLYLRNCDWNPQEAVEFATENAKPKSVGLCALYVRKSLNAGGIPLIRCGNAWCYKYILPIINFTQLDSKSSRKQGDIVVFQPIGGRKYGHIAIWNGKCWVSDFKQKGFFVHTDYMKEECEYAIFRRD